MSESGVEWSEEWSGVEWSGVEWSVTWSRKRAH